MEESIVKVINLSHKYNVQWAVKDIGFEINGPGVYGLLGANGAGKSTTMNIMCGVVKQTHGDVYIKGISMSKNPVLAKKHIGFLPQNPPLATELTVAEFLSYAASLRLMPAESIAKAVDEVMFKCQISHFRNRVIGNLSGGYQQRVGIAQAIIHKPDFVVLDEPTNGLDPNQIIEIRRLIKEIAQERTVVLSTHILQEVQALCNHIWMINEGSLVFAGSMEEFNNYIQPSAVIVSFSTSPGLEAIQVLQGVESVEEINDKRFRVQYSDLKEATEQIIASSYNKNWGLEELTPEKNSLDTVFATLTKKKQ